jgi:hypothetical protein
MFPILVLITSAFGCAALLFAAAETSLALLCLSLGMTGLQLVVLLLQRYRVHRAPHVAGLIDSLMPVQYGHVRILHLTVKRCYF